MAPRLSRPALLRHPVAIHDPHPEIGIVGLPGAGPGRRGRRLQHARDPIRAGIGRRAGLHRPVRPDLDGVAERHRQVLRHVGGRRRDLLDVAPAAGFAETDQPLQPIVSFRGTGSPLLDLPLILADRASGSVYDYPDRISVRMVPDTGLVIGSQAPPHYPGLVPTAKAASPALPSAPAGQ